MPQRVGAFGWANYAGSLHGASDHAGDAVSTDEWSEGSNVADEHVVAPVGSGATLEIADDCVSDFLRQWQPNLIASLPGHPQRAGLPLDIGQAQQRDITGSKSKPRQQQENRAVTPPLR